MPPTLEVDLAVERTRDGQTAIVSMAEPICTGDQVAFRLVPPRTGSVRLAHWGTAGDYVVLYPTLDAPPLVAAGAPLRLPGPGTFYTVLDPPGVERFRLLLVPSPSEQAARVPESGPEVAPLTRIVMKSLSQPYQGWTVDYTMEGVWLDFNLLHLASCEAVPATSDTRPAHRTAARD